MNSINPNPTVFQKVYSVTETQCKTGGLVGDVASGFKLANFWSELMFGAVSKTSQNITNCGSIIKNYTGFLELPSKVHAVKDSFSALQKGTAESVAVFVSDVLGVGKSVYEGIELAGTRFGLLEKNVVAFFQPVSSLATVSFGAKEVVFKDAPSVQENWSKSPVEANSSLIKLVKNISYAVVGALSLVATFFKAVFHSWLIPSLLTVALAASVSGRFFDAIMLSPKSMPI